MPVPIEIPATKGNLHQATLQWLLRFVSGETGRMVESFRVYYFANRSAIAAVNRPAIEDLLNTDVLSVTQFGELSGLLVDSSSPEALSQWLSALQLEYDLLLDCSASATAASDPKPTAEMLKAVVTMLLTQVVRLRSVRRALSIMRTICCLGGLGLAVIYFCVGVCKANVFGKDQGQYVNLIIPVALLGGLGGLISGLSRLYTLEWRGPSLLTYTHVSSLGIGLMLNLLLASFEGIVFAVILYAFFTGHFLEGVLFPSISWAGKDGSWQNFLGNGGPDSPADIGKLLVWSFIAGFSERLVPDLIRQLAAQAKIPAPKG